MHLNNPECLPYLCTLYVYLKSPEYLAIYILQIYLNNPEYLPYLSTLLIYLGSPEYLVIYLNICLTDVLK